MHSYWHLLLVWCAFIHAAPKLGSRSTEIDVQFRKRSHAISSNITVASFFIIGAPKCATTSLYDLLIKHPSICRSFVKEVHYFDHEEKWNKGVRYYKSHFDAKNCDRDKIKANMPVFHIDSTPDYFSNKLVPIRMHKSFSESDRAQKKFILILREPVEREFSWFNHRARYCTRYMHSYMEKRKDTAERVREGRELWDVKALCGDAHCRRSCSNRTATARPNREVEYIANFTVYMQNGDLVPHKSAYALHLLHWLKYFERRQFFVVNLATLLTNTTDTVQRMVRFLGLPPLPQRLYDSAGQVRLPHSNKAQVQTTFDCAVRSALYPHYAPLNEQLYALLRYADALPQGGSSHSAAPGSSVGSSSGGHGIGGTFEPPFPEFVTRPCQPGQLY